MKVGRSTMNTKLNSSRSSVRLAVSGVVAALGCAAVPAQAAVNLSLFENATTPHSVNVTPGGTFSVTLNLVSTAEQLTGVDYYFNISGAASGKFRLAGRDITGSPFSDLLKVNTGDNGSNGGVLDSNFSLLTPLNSLDLGAAIGNVSSALPPNTGANPASYLLAKYTFALASDIPVGTYTLSTYYFAGSGVATQAPLFIEQAFSQQASFSVIVTPVVSAPEPTGAMAMLGLGGMVLRRRRR